MRYIVNTAENTFRTDKVLIFSWVYRYNCTDINLSKTALSIENRQHPCLPCQREVDWRQGINCCLVAFCLRYVHTFYIANFSAVKTEGLLYTTNPSKTALSLENRHHPCLLMNALPVSHPSETLGVQLRASMPALEKGWGSVALLSRANYGGDCFPLAPSLRCYPLTFKRVRFCCLVKPIQLKCCPTKRTIGSILS